ncbi:hypothetical protein AX16_006295 [Volvariella volvacea WC 439]|nr:hypothetical protein AX16_006295 [Volvariella volvacea WC 439]
MKHQPSNGPSTTPANYYSSEIQAIQSKPNYATSSRTYGEEFRQYLGIHLGNPQPDVLHSAKEKLMRLEAQRFYELCADVYDELIRRKIQNPKDVPFLPAREDYQLIHNQARRLLSTIHPKNYKVLVGDVYYELCRRYPNSTKHSPDENALGSDRAEYSRPDYATSGSPPPSINIDPSQISVISDTPDASCISYVYRRRPWAQTECE